MNQLLLLYLKVCFIIVRLRITFSVIMTSDKVFQTPRSFLQSGVERLHVASNVWICDGIDMGIDCGPTDMRLHFLH